MNHNNVSVMADANKEKSEDDLWERDVTSLHLTLKKFCGWCPCSGTMVHMFDPSGKEPTHCMAWDKIGPLKDSQWKYLAHYSDPTASLGRQKTESVN